MDSGKTIILITGGESTIVVPQEVPPKRMLDR